VSSAFPSYSTGTVNESNADNADGADENGFFLSRGGEIVPTGVNALPGGDAYYRYMVKFWTTTTKTPDEIYNTGLAEVQRIRTAMDSIKAAVHFTGDLNAFFEYMKTDKRFMPYKKPEQVLAASATYRPPSIPG
jgi:hypothetical protein